MLSRRSVVGGMLGAGVATAARAGLFDYPLVSPVPVPMTEDEEKWFQTKFVASCCNIGDAFTSEKFFEKDGRFWAEITDGFDHHPNVQQVIIPPGTLRIVPPEILRKMNNPDDPAPTNKTGHGIIFLRIYLEGGVPRGLRWVGNGESRYVNVKPEEADVLCYWPPYTG